MEVNRLPSNEKVVAPPKPYNCAFCKKGFSNAQALGGHMNIHRKDRAKMRQSFDETTEDNHKKTSMNGRYTQTCENEGLYHSTESSKDKTRNLKTTCSSLSIEEIDGLDTTGRTLSSCPVSSSFVTDLDLELRLGHDPNYMRHRRGRG